MAEDGNELLADLGRLPLAEERGFARRQPVVGVEVQANEIGEKREHADDLGGLQLGRIGIDGAEGAEELAVAAANRDGDIALQTVDLRRVMVAVRAVLGDMLDDDRLAHGPDLVAERRLDLQLAAWLEPEIDLVANAAGDPALLRDTGDGRETEPGRAADDFEDLGNGVDRSDGVDVAGEILHWPQLTLRHAGTRGKFSEAIDCGKTARG